MKNTVLLGTFFALFIIASWFFGVAAWGIGQPLTGGHHSTMGCVASFGETMLRWHTIYPGWSDTTSPPPPSGAYINHPYGIFWAVAIFLKLFGYHSWAVRLLPAVMSGAMPVLVYRTAKLVWGPPAGAIAAVGFTVLPITLAFAGYLWAGDDP